MAPDGSDESFKAAPPLHPFDEKWYVRAEGETHGPYEGRRVKELVEQGRLTADSPLARLGATEWSAVRDVPAFAGLLPPALPSAASPSLAPRPQAYAAGASAAAAGGAVHYAGFWIRVLAYLIDYVLVYLIVIAVSLLIGFVVGLATKGGTGNSEQFTQIVGGIAGVIGVLIVVAYYVAFNSGSWQATPGKRLLGIHIITESGKPVSGWLAFGRYLAYIISSLPLCIGFMVIGWNDEKKGFHDMICKTRVIYGKL
ncbi:MAG: RDD family protein [Methylovirgula sp.]